MYEGEKNKRGKKSITKWQIVINKKNICVLLLSKMKNKEIMHVINE